MNEIINELPPSPSATGMNICPKCGNFMIAKEKCPDCGTVMVDCDCNETKWTDMLLDGTLSKWESQMRSKYVLSSDEFSEKLYNKRLNEEKQEDKYYNNLIENTEPILHCPYCNSTNVSKITGTERAISVIGLGIFSKKINKSFKCKSCGGTF